VILEEGVETIGIAAFDNNLGLTHITIPKSVKRICSYAFGLTCISSAVYNGTKAQWNSIQKDYKWKPLLWTVYCSDGYIIV
jgi:hypothetical protein